MRKQKNKRKLSHWDIVGVFNSRQVNNLFMSAKAYIKKYPEQAKNGFKDGHISECYKVSIITKEKTCHQN